MKNLEKYFLILFLLVGSFLNAQNKWIENKEMGFKVLVPSNYKSNQFKDGSDLVQAFVSPDENVAVQVRVFDVSDDVSIDNIISAFEKTVIKGAQSLIQENYVLNGINGKMSGYRWRTSNINIIVGAFHTIKDGKGYVVWSLVPENLFTTRNAESDAILNTFTLLQKEIIPEIPQIMEKSAPKLEQQVKDPVDKSLTLNEEFHVLVSDDACIENLLPKSAKLTRAEVGLKVWEYYFNNQGDKISIVLQNVIKQGSGFKNFMENHITSVINNGAAVISKNYGILNNMESCTYVYENNGSRFLYTAVDGPKSFFLLGFVGKSDFKNDIEKLHNTVYPSIKKSLCDEVDEQESDILKNNSSSEQTGNYKQITLDNTSNAYNFAKGKLTNAAYLTDADILNEPWCTDLPALCGNWVATGKTKMEEVVIPPSSGYISEGQSFMDCQDAPINEVLVFKLNDGTYAKLKILKDEKSNSSGQCQHKITCIVEYPAFTISGQVEKKDVSGFWSHVAEKTKSTPNESKLVTGYKQFFQYGEFSFQVPQNWQSQSQSGRTTWYNPQPDGGLISHMQLHESTNFEKFVNTESTSTLKNLGVRTIGGFEACLHQSKTIAGMQNNIVLRTDILYIKTARKVHMITFQASEGLFSQMLEPRALQLLNTLIKN